MSVDERPPLLYGVVRLRLVKGFENNASDYDLDIDHSYMLYTSAECSNLRIRPEETIGETQQLKNVARLELRAEKAGDAASHPSVELCLYPVEDRLRVDCTPVTIPHHIIAGATRTMPEHDSKDSSTRAHKYDRMISPSTLVEIEVAGFAATFITDFSSISGTEEQSLDEADSLLHRVIPSSEVRQPEMEHRGDTPPPPRPLYLESSIIKETPSASRYMDHLETNESNQEDGAEKSQAHGGDPKNDLSLKLSNGIEVADETEDEDLDETITPVVPYDLPTDSLGPTANINSIAIEQADGSQDEEAMLPKKRAPSEDKSHASKKRRAESDTTSEPSNKKVKSLGQDVKQSASEPTVVKKGRGRPPKSKQSIIYDDRVKDTPVSQEGSGMPTASTMKTASALIESSKVDDEGIDSKVVTPKKPISRGRGRPKKQDNLVVADADEQEDEAAELSGEQKRSSQRNAGKKLVVVKRNCGLLDKPSAQVKKFVNTYIKIVEKVDETIDLVVSTDKLSKTAKIFKAIVLGKPVITEKWLEQSVKRNKLLPFTEFFASDPAGEQNFDAAKEWSSGEMRFTKDDFKDKILYITPTLRSLWGATFFSAMQEIGEILGFKNVTTYPASSTKETFRNLVALGKDEADKDAFLLHTRDGLDVYNADLLAVIVFRGRFELDHGYRIDFKNRKSKTDSTSVETTPTGKGGRKRKA